jgi:hypothetical protein
MTSRTVIIFLLVFFLDTLIVRAVPQDGQDNALKVWRPHERSLARH